ncbi:YisL family protein [Anoxybacteroides rupiense]|uniref:YisL family protein n=1 Tax=Anoxybacteroides rupiense TaxID=311460 RepID=UPI001BAD4963|nr:YisL family protein [Anoxybacillus rupiensis]MBS2770541.1 YisL family protein [Anoxybacillus rupiensis]
MTHAHITTWVIAFILFFVSLSMYKAHSPKAKIAHMVLRLFYLLIIATGAMLLFSLYSISVLYIVKAIVGLWVIVAMEMVTVRAKKGERAQSAWIQLVLAFVLVLYLGLKLPLGFHVFS